MSPPLRRPPTRTITTIIMDTVTIMTMRMTTPTTTIIMAIPMITIISTASHAITSMTTPITITPIVTAMGRNSGPRPPDHEPVATSSEHAALYRLMTWLSPSFPVGAFSYSSGIEWAVEAGDVVDGASLTRWLSAMLTDGAGFCDGVLLCHAWRAAEQRSDAALIEIAELAGAFTPSRERQLETTAQGRAFADIVRAAWSCETLDRLSDVWNGPLAYPVAVGAVAAGHGVPLDLTLRAFLHALTANWISAGVRLIPLGQTESQRVLAALEDVVASVAARALGASLDDLGSATFRADLASMHHETQYTRLFRS
jgi:urease accessory protein